MAPPSLGGWPHLIEHGGRGPRAAPGAWPAPAVPGSRWGRRAPPWVVGRRTSGWNPRERPRTCQAHRQGDANDSITFLSSRPPPVRGQAKRVVLPVILL